MIIALYGGVLADRVKKKPLLFYVQIVLGLGALFLAIVMVMGVVAYWHVVVYAVIWRTAMTLGLPARLAFISEITSRSEFPDAYALYYVALNLLGVIGPALAGALVVQIGVSGVLFVIAFCQWTFNGLLIQIQPSQLGDPRDDVITRGDRSVRKDISEMLHFASRDIPLLTLIGVKIALAFLAMPAITLMPAFSAKVLNIDAVGFGILQAAGGLGSFLGSLFITATRNTQRKPLLLLITCVIRGIALLFALSSAFSLALLIRLVIGITTSTYVMMNSVLFQLSASDNNRGRIMGLYMISFDFIGSIPLSILAEEVGISTSIGLGGTLLLGVSVALLLFLPAFRNRRM